MLIGDIFLEDFGVARKNVWRVRGGNVTHREVSALAASTEIRPRTSVEPTDVEEKGDA